MHISEKEIYISFCGTDASIIGWKEDFNLAYMDIIPAQVEGVKYLESVSKKYSDSLIHLGGHSKGGNVAIYAGMNCDRNIINRIIDIVNYDGPGFDSKVIDSMSNIDILDKVVTYIPQGSIIGRVMEHRGNIIIVYSGGKGILQHDIYTWDILKDYIVRYGNLTDNSEIINKSVCEFLKNTTPEKRKIFIDSIFEILYSTSAESFKGFTKVFIQKLPVIVKTYSNLSDEDKKIMIEMVKIFGKSYYDSLKGVKTKKGNIEKIDGGSANNE